MFENLTIKNKKYKIVCKHWPIVMGALSSFYFVFFVVKFSNKAKARCQFGRAESFDLSHAEKQRG